MSAVLLVFRAANEPARWVRAANAAVLALLDEGLDAASKNFTSDKDRTLVPPTASAAALDLKSLDVRDWLALRMRVQDINDTILAPASMHIFVSFVSPGGAG